MTKILVVDNEERMCKVIQTALELENYIVQTAYNGSSALEFMKNDRFEIVITDLKMSGIDGIQVLKETRKMSPIPEVILITAYASQHTAMEAMRLGAYDYLIKPFKMEELLVRVKRALEQRGLQAENKLLKKDEKRSLQVPNIIGKSAKMREVYQLISKVAKSDATVLIRGESGTGKELVAEAIHLQSERAGDNFVAINCAAVPENLLESELFGYEKGAFTGANKRKIGMFESANRGTVFLDEIGDMPLNIQAKLLRVLQNKEVVRLGGVEKIDIDVRVLAATNQDLEEMINLNKFRSDLFYRINTFPIYLPPLRERKEDLPELIEHFLGTLGDKGMTLPAKQKLMEYNWPGNVRELENVLERASIVSETIIDLNHLPKNLLGSQSFSEDYQFPENGLNLEALEKSLLISAIKKAGGNKSRAAELLGIT
ncbi:MAG: sigma-54-dependent Fis family transcriptional regulator, partial [bacterium]